MASLATQVCWGPRCHSSPLADASEGLCWSCSRALPSPASCAGGRGGHRVAKSKPECLGVCRKQLGPEQGPRRGLPAPFLRLPSCPRGSWCLRSWKPGLGFGVRQPPRLDPGSTGWGGRRKAPPPPLVRPWPSPCRAGLEAWCPAHFPGDGAVRLPGFGLEGPRLLWGSGQPHVLGEAGFPLLPTPVSCGASSPGPPHCMHAGL